MPEESRTRVLSISMTPEQLRDAQELAAERMRRGARGGISGAVRELMEAGKAKLKTQRPRA